LINCAACLPEHVNKSVSSLETRAPGYHLSLSLCYVSDASSLILLVPQPGIGFPPAKE